MQVALTYNILQSIKPYIAVVHSVMKNAANGIFRDLISLSNEKYQQAGIFHGDHFFHKSGDLLPKRTPWNLTPESQTPRWPFRVKDLKKSP